MLLFVTCPFEHRRCFTQVLPWVFPGAPLGGGGVTARVIRKNENRWAWENEQIWRFSRSPMGHKGDGRGGCSVLCQTLWVPQAVSPAHLQHPALIKSPQPCKLDTTSFSLSVTCGVRQLCWFSLHWQQPLTGAGNKEETLSRRMEVLIY